MVVFNGSISVSALSLMNRGPVVLTHNLKPSLNACKTLVSFVRCQLRHLALEALSWFA